MLLMVSMVEMTTFTTDATKAMGGKFINFSAKVVMLWSKEGKFQDGRTTATLTMLSHPSRAPEKGREGNPTKHETLWQQQPIVVLAHVLESKAASTELYVFHTQSYP